MLQSSTMLETKLIGKSNRMSTTRQTRIKSSRFRSRIQLSKFKVNLLLSANLVSWILPTIQAT